MSAPCGAFHPPHSFNLPHTHTHTHTHLTKAAQHTWTHTRRTRASARWRSLATAMRRRTLVRPRCCSIDAEVAMIVERFTSVCVCIQTYMYTCTHVYMHTYTHIHIYTYTHMCMYTHMHIYIYAYIHIYNNMVMDTYFSITRLRFQVDYFGMTALEGFLYLQILIETKNVLYHTM